MIFHRYRMNQLISIRQLSTVHYFENAKDYRTPDHSHNTWEFVYCDRGQVAVWDDGHRMELGAGKIFFHPPESRHHIEVGSRVTTMFILSFACSNECMKLFLRKCFSITQEQRTIIDLMIQELRGAFELSNGELKLGEFKPSPDAPAGAEQLVCNYLEWLLISVIRSDVGNILHDDVTSEQLVQVLSSRTIDELKSYIQCHLQEQITIDDLARHVHYSRTYITVQFKEATGMSIMDYLEQQRIEKAKEMLRQGRLSSTQIADELGYSSLQYFSRRFRKSTGCPPSRFVSSLRDTAGETRNGDPANRVHAGKTPEDI